MTIYGYARVSTDSQELDGQLDRLTAAGATKVFSEKQSGAKTENRPELAKVIKKLQQDDILIVTALDRLGRSLRDILNVLEAITKERKANFKILDEPWLDTQQSMVSFWSISLVALRN